MKDYRLSEVKEICEKASGDCSKCIFGEKQEFNYCCEVVGYDYKPELWDIDEEQSKDNLETFTPAIDLMKSNYRRIDYERL